MRPDSDSPRPLYRALSFDSEIRLVILLPSTNFQSAIECRLEHATLGHGRPFEALSYVWGEPNFTETIVLDGQSVGVTPRLAAALRHLRLPAENRILWIDALCINQQDLMERQHQVSYMRRIYASCSTDILWMGPQNDTYSRAMKAIRQLAVLAKKHQGFMKELKEYQEGLRPSITRPVYEESEKLDQIAQDWVETLMHKDLVWKRVWIIQEVSCAPKVLLTCGHDMLEWSLVETVMSGKTYYTDAFHGPFGHGGVPDGWEVMFSTAKVISTQRNAVAKMQEGENSDLLDVLARFKHTMSSDPRDKIYALLGLVSDTIGIKVDYTRSAAETFVAVALINSSSNLDILCQCPWKLADRDQDLPKLEGLPTWVPDFRATQQGRFLFAQRGIYSAGRAKCVVPCVRDGPAILLNGHLLGRLNAFQGDMSPSNAERRYGQPHSAIIRAWAYKNLILDDRGKIAKHNYCTGEDQVQAFWRTLGGDCSAYPQKRLTSDKIASEYKTAQQVIDNTYEYVSRSEFSGSIRLMFDRLVLNEGWRFYTSDNGFFVLAQEMAMAGDVITVLDGAKVPMILRPVGNTTGGEQSYMPISGAYVHGFMDGEALNPACGFDQRLFRVV